jgi:hypothetical protein
VWTVSSTVIDIRAKARDAKVRSAAGYETLAPAVKELQGLSSEAQGWVDSAHQRIFMLEQNRGELEKRIIRLEGYIEALGQRRSMPRTPAPVKKDKPVAAGAGKRPAIKRPARPIPDDIQEAKSYQQQRVRLDCDKDDPLCGALE